MKKHFKRKSFSPPPQSEEGAIADSINKMQQQLNFLEKKIDILIGQSSQTPFKEEQPKPFQRFDRSHHHGERRPDANYRERVLHKAICAECKQECEVPFKPSGERPVYCKDCFSKRKGGGAFKGRHDTGPKEAARDETGHMDTPHGGEKKKFFGKKRPSGKRRKTRS
ncbi:MAG: hypothetical protein Q8R38_06985 [Candidatus Omnitrophota bacterium]|nr:hypothetical protein [Candidatus Omnitrophota bacterium]